jgi:hypothetical protein
MKKSLLAALVAGIFLLSVGAFAGTVTISDIPDIIVVDDGQPSGVAGDQDFVFSKPFKFADYIYTSGSSSTNPITVSYIVYDSSPTILAKLALSIEGVAHPMTTTGGQTAPAVLGTVAGLDAGTQGITANVLFLEYVTTPPLVGSTPEYTRNIKFTGANGADLPGTSPRQIGIYMDRTGNDRFSGVTPLFVDDFDLTSEGWIFTIAYGTLASATPGSGTAGSALSITYNNTMSFSYWQRPIGTGGQPPIAPLTSDKLYRVTANISSTIAPSITARGGYPDFRMSTHLANGASMLWYLSSFLSDGGANYISPSTTPRDYTIFFEATGVPTGYSSSLVLQFEGFNFPYTSDPLYPRPNFIGASIGLNRIQVDELTYSIDAAGTTVHIADDTAAQFALGSGTQNAWQSSDPFTGTGMPATTRGLATDNLGLVITSPTFTSSEYFAYGVWDSNPNFGTSIPNFSGSTLYRATFKITTTHVGIAGTQNFPTPQVRIQTGDSHLAQAANLYSNFNDAGNKQLTGSEGTTGPIELWFWYPSARTGTLAQKIYPSFELLTFGPYTLYKMPSNAALTLRYYALTQQAAP